MVGPSADRSIEWEGGSLGELVAALQAAALPVRIEVIAAGTTDSNAGEVHLLAGGLADAFAGSLRRDDAMAALQRLEGARYVVEARLPDPESGSLGTPGPSEGSLRDRSVAALMRYCEDYVLTCRLEVWRGQERAVISYQRGEIVSTMVGGSDGSERLPEVMGWNDGSYEIVLPAPALPPSTRKSAVRAVEVSSKSERRRHGTLPLMPTSDATEAAPAATPAVPAPPTPRAGAQPQGKPAPQPSSPSARPAAAPPAGATARPAPAAPSTGAEPPLRQQVATQPLGARPPGAAAQPEGARPGAAAKAPGAVPPTHGPLAGPSRPAAQTPAAQTLSREPASARAADAGPVAGSANQRRRTPTPAMGSPAGRPPAEPLPAEMTTRGIPPVPAVPLISPPARSAVQTSPGMASAAKAGTPAAGEQAQTLPKTASAAATPPKTAGAPVTPPLPVPPAPAPFQLAQPVPGARSAKPAPASNDLKPASGTIEAKTRHPNHLPTAEPPIEIADPPSPDPQPEPVNQVVVASRPGTSRRVRPDRKTSREQPVKIYVLVGLAIGAGIVLAYWAYWYLPFFHH